MPPAGRAAGFAELFELSPWQVWWLQEKGLVFGKVKTEANLLQPQCSMFNEESR